MSPLAKTHTPSAPSFCTVQYRIRIHLKNLNTIPRILLRTESSKPVEELPSGRRCVALVQILQRFVWCLLRNLFVGQLTFNQTTNVRSINQSNHDDHCTHQGSHFGPQRPHGILRASHQQVDRDGEESTCCTAKVIANYPNETFWWHACFFAKRSRIPRMSRPITFQEMVGWLSFIACSLSHY